MTFIGTSSDDAVRAKSPFLPVAAEPPFSTGGEVHHGAVERLFSISLGNVLRNNSAKVEVVPPCIHEALASTAKKCVLDRLQKGETMFKVHRRRLTGAYEEKFCKVDDSLLYFCYSSVSCGCGSKIGRTRVSRGCFASLAVDIRHVRTVSFGRKDNFKHLKKTFSDFKILSIVFDNSSRLPLNFVTLDEESAAFWVEGINLLKKRILSLKPRLHHVLSAWELFTVSKEHKEGHISSTEVYKILNNHSISTTTIEKELLDRRANQDGGIDFASFFEIFKAITKRPEIGEIFRSASADKKTMTVRELYKFIQMTQKDKEVTENECREIINDYESRDDAREQLLMTVSGFSLYLSTSFGEIFNWRHDQVYQDMKQPLCHYYVASSHNTYLTGDQLTDSSSTDAYMYALLKGCRCVELDCWDGPDGEPVIYHGRTLTTKIKFKDAVEVIGKFAFETSVYPLILSLELHCSVSQQDKMAYYLKTILGSEILTSSLFPGDKEVKLPSPSALKGKILIKSKKITLEPTDEVEGTEDLCKEEQESKVSNVFYFDISLTERQARKTFPRPRQHAWLFEGFAWSETLLPYGSQIKHQKNCSSGLLSGGNNNRIRSTKRDQQMIKLTRNRSLASNSSNSAPSSTNSSTRKSFPRTKSSLAPSLSDLVIYCQSVKFKSFEKQEKQNKFLEISSFAEGKACKLAKSQTEEAIKYHQQQMSRTYPAAFRTDSSNYDPQPLWNAGFQMVALNYQTKCDEMEIYNAKFRQNGNCGYVLKPQDQRMSAALCEENISSAKVLDLRLICGQNLVDEQRQNSNYYSLVVEVSISGWIDDEVEKDTGCGKNSGSSPKWDKKFLFFVRKPELAMLHFIVKDREKTPERLGHYTLPFTSIAQGYRHVPVLRRDGTNLPGASLFVHVAVDEATKMHLNAGKVKVMRNSMYDND